MTPANVIRKAAQVLRADGWCKTAEGETAPVHARDAADRPVTLYSETAGDTSKGRINPAAVKFSAYGAIAKVIAQAGGGVAQSGLLWDTLTRLARTEMGGEAHAAGGNNFVHPLFGYNDAPDRTAEHVIAFLETAANVIDPPVTA